MNERRPRHSAPSNGTPPLMIALLGVGLLFFLFLGVKALLDHAPETTLSNTDTQLPSGSSTATAATHPDSIAATGNTAVSSSEAIETTLPPAEPAFKMTTVDDSYFSDALFVGDSRTDGLCLYSPPGSCKHFCAQSLTVFTIMEKDMDAYGFTGLRALLQGMQFGKVYIMLGINECGSDTAEFAKKYRSVVEEIRQYQPNALIYIQSICYVTQNRELQDPVFASSKIKEKNEAIRAIANDTDIFYLEVNDCMNDGTDHLPTEYTGDGVHLMAKYYSLWHDYLLQHAVVDAKHPWQPGQEELVGAAAEDP